MHHVVGPAHDPWVVGHDDDRATGRRGRDRRDTVSRCRVVQAGGGLVEQEQVGTPDHGPGDRQALALTSGEDQARLPHDGVETRREVRSAKALTSDAVRSVADPPLLLASGFPSAMLRAMVSSRNHDSWGT